MPSSNRIDALYSPRLSAIFTRLAQQRFGTLTDAHQLMEDARQQLALGLERRLRDSDFEPTDSYLIVAFKHALTDVMRARFGRPEPRAWLKAFGPLGRWLFERYCLEGRAQPEIIQAALEEPSLAQLTTEDQIRQLLWEMDRVQECEGPRGQEYSLHDEDGQVLEIPVDASPERQLMEEQRLALQARIFQHGQASLQAARGLISHIDSLLGQAGERLRLDDDQRFILQANLDGELTEERMGELLNGLSVRQVRYRRQQALEKLRELLDKAGIRLDDLLPEDDL
ncbi:hypothetical protein D5125_01120 [Magnetovirga frankeli]|uniref:hypothetical protein n=1 Tax=Magnetovirga frankeli TaxID=947516 RepID=UPI0012939549|nr:hypothetical protein D5125_01120 [gamma proteobacterium SS-5]